MAKLRAISGPLSGQTIEVEHEVVIGRQDTDINIDDLEISRRHAVVRRHANRLQVEDLGSSNGTFVDGTRIEEPTLLGGGAEIRVGTTVLVVEGVLPVGEAAATIRSESIVPDLARRVTQVQSVPVAPPTQEDAVPAATSSGQSRSAAAAPAGVSASNAAAAPAPAAGPAPGAPPAATPAPTGPSGPIGEFRPPQRRRGGLATRSWLPVVLSFGTVILVAIALVLYFALAK